MRKHRHKTDIILVYILLHRVIERRIVSLQDFAMGNGINFHDLGSRRGQEGQFAPGPQGLRAFLRSQGRLISQFCPWASKGSRDSAALVLGLACSILQCNGNSTS